MIKHTNYHLYPLTFSEYLVQQHIEKNIFPLYPYAKSGRDEIGKMPKIYFWDTGIRNALIQNFDSLDIRSDSKDLK